jgi:hypothetical protein
MAVNSPNVKTEGPATEDINSNVHKSMVLRLINTMEHTRLEIHDWRTACGWSSTDHSRPGDRESLTCHVIYMKFC